MLEERRKNEFQTKFCTNFHSEIKDPLIFLSHIKIENISKLEEMNWNNCWNDSTEFLVLKLTDPQNELHPYFELRDLCIDLIVIAFMRENASFIEHHQLCQNHKGFIPSQEEVITFKNTFFQYLQQNNVQIPFEILVRTEISTINEGSKYCNIPDFRNGTMHQA